MITIGGVPFTYSEILLSTGLLLSFSVAFVALRRMTLLQRRFQTVQLAMAREIKMVNQGAIGVGRRMTEIEKKLKSRSNVASFAPAQELKQPSPRFADVQKTLEPKAKVVETAAVGSKGLSTKAEQALSAWLNDQQTA